MMDSHQFMNNCAYWLAKGEKQFDNYFRKRPALPYELEVILNAHHLHFPIEVPNVSCGRNNSENVKMLVVYSILHCQQTAFKELASVLLGIEREEGERSVPETLVRRTAGVFPSPLFFPHPLLYFCSLENLISVSGCRYGQRNWINLMPLFVVFTKETELKPESMDFWMTYGRYVRLRLLILRSYRNTWAKYILNINCM